MSGSDSEGPAWNKFWMSLDNDTESAMSGEGSHHRPHTPGHRSAGGFTTSDMARPTNTMERYDSVVPGDSASHNGEDVLSAVGIPHAHGPEDIPFPFKFKAPSGRIHRLQVVPSDGLANFIDSVTEKLGKEVDTLGGEAMFLDGKLSSSGYHLSYVDNEGDTVSITTDRDLLDAVLMAQQGSRTKVDLFVHHPEKPPMTAPVDPVPASLPTPPLSSVTPRRQKQKGGRGIMEQDGSEDAEEDGEQEDEEASSAKVKRKAKEVEQKVEQIVAGVPNEILLPGAIAALAVVIVGVFAISRMSSK